MKKAMTVILWLGLGACLVLVFSLNSQKNALKQDWKGAVRKNEVLQTLYDQAKAEWEENTEELTAARDALSQETQALNKRLNALTKELKEAQEQASRTRNEWEAQRQALNAEREAATFQLSDVLAMLSTPLPEIAAEQENGAEEESLFLPLQPEKRPRILPHPVHGETRKIDRLPE